MKSNKKKYQVSVVLVTEKQQLSQAENISLRRALEVFAAFKIYLVIPEYTDPSAMVDPGKVEVLKLPGFHFESINSYSALLLDGSFYEQFIESEHILIHQLDCFAFHADFSPFLKFDYVGAPWLHTQNHQAEAIIKTIFWSRPFMAASLLLGWLLKRKMNAVGNGGFSLRRTDKFIELLQDQRIQKLKKNWLEQKRPHEDVFYSILVPIFYKNFAIADISTAAAFAFETEPQGCYMLNKQQLPLGCHAWAKHDPDFWRPHFHLAGYPI